MLKLRNLNSGDLHVLKKYYFKSLSDEEISENIEKMNRKLYEGKYFEMFAIEVGCEVVGLVSLFEHNSFTVSAGPEIFEPYKRKGYGYEALRMAYNIAKEKGYLLATAQIRTDNIGSIALHEKAGFELDSELINRKGNKVYIYQKLI